MKPSLTKTGKYPAVALVGYTANYVFNRQADKTTGVTAEKERFETELMTKVDQNTTELKSLNDKTDNNTSRLENIEKQLAEMSNKGKSKFLPDFDNINLASLKEFFDTLTIYQVGCIFDISVCSGIAITLIEILAIKFGNELIKYYDLENKYPKLTIFFKIRAKLQKYVLIWNVILIFAFCLAGISFNIYMFFIT